MTDSLFLGVCAYDPKPYTRVEPVALAENGAWRVYGEWRGALPNEGRAFAPNMAGFTAGQLLAFTVTANERLDADKSRDKFIATSQVRVQEVLDYRTFDAEVARRALVEKGISAMLPGSDRVVIALPGSLCVVVRMVKHPVSPVWIADFDGLESLATYALDDRVFDGARIGARVLSVPGMTVGAQVSTVNWCRDADFLGTVLKRLRKVAQNSDVLPISRSQIPNVVSYLERAGLTPSNGEDLTPTLARLRAFASDLSAHHRDVESIVEVVAELRPVAHALAERRASIETDLKLTLEPVVRAELQSALGDLTDRRDLLIGEIAELEELAHVARTEKERADAAAIELQAILAERLGALHDNLEAGEQGAPAPEATFRQITDRLKTVGVDIDLKPSAYAPWVRRSHATKGPPTAWSEAEAALRSTANFFGHSQEEIISADLAVRSGRVVVLPSPAALSVVRCHAASIASGALYLHALDPATISPDDLWRPASALEPTAFARAWTAAKLDPRRFRLVLLEGIERTPSDLWLPSFIELLEDPERPSNLLVYASIGKAMVATDRFWKEIGTEVSALDPALPTGVTAEILARAGHGISPNKWLDATAAPRPEVTTLATHLAMQGSGLPSRLLARQAAAFMAAWSLRPNDAAGLLPTSSNSAECLRRGATWLEHVLATAS